MKKKQHFILRNGEELYEIRSINIYKNGKWILMSSRHNNKTTRRTVRYCIYLKSTIQSSLIGNVTTTHKWLVTTAIKKLTNISSQFEKFQHIRKICM